MELLGRESHCGGLPWHQVGPSVALEDSHGCWPQGGICGPENRGRKAEASVSEPAPTVFRLGPAGEATSVGMASGPQNRTWRHVPRGISGLVGRGRRSQQDAPYWHHVWANRRWSSSSDAFGDDADSPARGPVARHAGQRFGARRRPSSSGRTDQFDPGSAAVRRLDREDA